MPQYKSYLHWYLQAKICVRGLFQVYAYQQAEIIGLHQ